ncbi:MAG TPA: HAD hydrolase-like protein [Polyangiaceae bacterium]|jgi:beta-phosphoglucomutase-like phosphatase (HAD superfamily)|nr:HAD hydrolase-like protein [Polyangiaceae bacterium]
MNHSRAVLMDIDGTLLNSSEAQTQSWLRILQDFGYDVEYRQVRARIGIGQDRLLRELCGVSEASPRARRMLPARELMLRSYYLPKVEVFPQAHQFLARVQRGGAKLAVVTSLPRSEALALLGRGRLLTEIDHVICKEDAVQSKPAADGVLAALDRMRVRPDQAIMLGSSPYDLAAAHAAQVPSVALKSAGWPDSTLLDAVGVYKDLADLLSQFDCSPLADDNGALSVPRTFMWREPGLARRTSRPSRPHAA